MKNNAAKELQKIIGGIEESYKRWDNIFKNGCNDPSFPDGVNLNLIRNHIIYFKQLIEDICNSEGFDYPGVYYKILPPLVKDNYMANLDQTDRVRRLEIFYGTLDTRMPLIIKRTI